MRELIIASGAAALAATSGETLRFADADEQPEIQIATVQLISWPGDEPQRAFATEPGEWRYKEMDGHPWAGYGPSASAATFAISCQKGRIIFYHAGDLPGGEMQMTMKAGDAAAEIDMISTGSEMPMVEGSLPVESGFIDALLKTDRPFTMRLGDHAMALPPDNRYRNVILIC